ncbi:hypothetical protein M422DRAFT_163449 [Sphaerobolus stellatus SS14]|uniref:Cation efflux protein transmembrane domain-containing protein n=1 Tax=Sphaerobolus stellatus (strain SS14) TaxID=990650 RepID=A0A0C9UW12_SPHS4|nr:hypothetical protein M422DRAFT_163449 [Sphaerobolus stellatus SS14]
MNQRRAFSSKDDSGATSSNGAANRHKHDHEHDHHEEHEHKHSLLGGHNHDHSHAPDAEKIMEALKGGGDKGSRITLIGLYANVGLTGAKGLAGWYLHSASLLADAGHSLSDLLGDFVTLFCWQLSRRPRSNKYPYGFGKFETMGTTAVSLLLVGGALGIGFHSYHLLMEALYPMIQTMPSGALQETLQSAAQATGSIAAQVGGGHSHSHGGDLQALDPNAAWFALISVLAKEYLYRITKKVADEERSSVLRANAIHHRSDAWSSLVALFAILGSWAVPGLPLDPIGGLLVSFVIFGQGLGLLRGAFRQLTDAGVSDSTRLALAQQLKPLYEDPSLRIPNLLSVQDLRAARSGALMFVDLVVVVPNQATMLEAYIVQQEIRKHLKAFKKEISEVRINLVPESEASVVEEENK